MRHYVIELRYSPVLGKAYASVQSKHLTFTAALRAMDRYIKEDKRADKYNADKHRITYVIGRI